MKEVERGCGFRQVGGLYLEGSGLAVPCDRLPFNIELCPVCSQGIKFSRGFTWVHWHEYAEHHIPCKCKKSCPVCHPIDEEPVFDENGVQTGFKPVMHGLMWVGHKFYSPESFIREAVTLGVCKRIANIPKQLVVGKTWVLLAHRKSGRKLVDADGSDSNSNGSLDGKREVSCSAVFYGFIPQRVTKIVTEFEALDKELMANLKKRGITVLVDVDSDSKGNVYKTVQLKSFLRRK